MFFASVGTTLKKLQCSKHPLFFPTDNAPFEVVFPIARRGWYPQYHLGWCSWTPWCGGGRDMNSKAHNKPQTRNNPGADESKELQATTTTTTTRTTRTTRTTTAHNQPTNRPTDRPSKQASRQTNKQTTHSQQPMADEHGYFFAKSMSVLTFRGLFSTCGEPLKGSQREKTQTLHEHSQVNSAHICRSGLTAYDHSHACSMVYGKFRSDLAFSMSFLRVCSCISFTKLPYKLTWLGQNQMWSARWLVQFTFSLRWRAYKDHLGSVIFKIGCVLLMQTKNHIEIKIKFSWLPIFLPSHPVHLSFYGPGAGPLASWGCSLSDGPVGDGPMPSGWWYLIF